VALKYWEIIADNLKKAGWSLGYVSALDSNGRTIWIADAHHDDGGANAMCRPKKPLRRGATSQPGHNRGDDLPADGIWPSIKSPQFSYLKKDMKY
jgi:hypothetical protein